MCSYLIRKERKVNGGVRGHGLDLLRIVADTWAVTLLLEPHLVHFVGSWDVTGHLLSLKHGLDVLPLFKEALALGCLLRGTLSGA